MATNINGQQMARQYWMSDAGWASAGGSPPSASLNGLLGEVRRVASTPKPERGSGTIPWFNVQNQVGACGVGNAYGFSEMSLTRYNKVDAERYKKDFSKESIKERSGGCGFLSAAFIDTPACKAVYKDLKEKFPILYQSPIRFNVNSGNNFFFCVFDTGEKDMPKEYSDPDHENYDEDHDPGFPNGLEW